MAIIELAKCNKFWKYEGNGSMQFFMAKKLLRKTILSHSYLAYGTIKLRSSYKITKAV